KPLATGIHPTSVAVADLNGDGKPDLVSANRGTRDAPGNTVSVLLGNGEGSFQTQQSFATGEYPSSVAAADINGDGKPDLVSANTTSRHAPYSTVSVLQSYPTRRSSDLQPLATGIHPSSVAVADLNGDGKPDLVSANRGTFYVSGNTVSVLLGNG